MINHGTNLISEVGCLCHVAEQANFDYTGEHLDLGHDLGTYKRVSNRGHQGKVWRTV